MHFRLITLLLLGFFSLSSEPLQFRAVNRTPSGHHLTWTLEMRSHGDPRPSAVEWTLRYDPSNIRTIDVQASAAAAAAGKAIRCTSQPGATTCVLWGLNRTQIPDGSIAEISYELSVREAPDLQCQIRDVSAASAFGGGLAAESESHPNPPPSAIRPSLLLLQRSLVHQFWIHRSGVIIAAVMALSGTAGCLLLTRWLRRRSRLERKLRSI